MEITPSDEVVARGRRTIIRRKRLGDVADEYRWRKDPELAEYDASRPVQVSFEEYQRNWRYDYRFSDVAERSFAIEDEQGRHIGNIMYYNLDGARGEAEIGIGIGEREYWSQGYGSDALAALVAALLRSGGLRRLYLHTLEWNQRAQRSFQKAGFAVCGAAWRDGQRFLVMEMRREWLEEGAGYGPALAQKSRPKVPP